MKTLLILTLALLATPLPAQIRVNPNGNVTPAPLCVVAADGTCASVTASNPLPTSGGGGGGGSTPTGSAGTPNAAVVTVQGISGGTAQNTTPAVDSGGTRRSLLTSTTGTLAAPVAGTANSTGTVTSLAASTSTTICPATTNPVVYEVQIYGTGGVLLGLDGQTLTATTPVAGSGAYMYLPTQYTLYVGPVARTNIVTAYTGTAQVVVCNIVTRQ